MEGWPATWAVHVLIRATWYCCCIVYQCAIKPLCGNFNAALILPLDWLPLWPWTGLVVLSFYSLWTGSKKLKINLNIIFFFLRRTSFLDYLLWSIFHIFTHHITNFLFGLWGQLPCTESYIINSKLPGVLQCELRNSLLTTEPLMYHTRYSNPRIARTYSSTECENRALTIQATTAGCNTK